MGIIRRSFKTLKGQRGFTLIELIVAVGIMLILAAAATPFLLSHLKDAKVANENEKVLNVKAAFDSYYTKNGGLVSDSDSDSDYLDEMESEGWISGDPSKNDVTWKVKKYTDSGKNAYYIFQETTSTDGYNYFKDIVDDIDTIIDGSDTATSGTYQYTDTGSAVKACYLLYKDADMTSWQTDCQ